MTLRHYVEIAIDIAIGLAAYHSFGFWAKQYWRDPIEFRRKKMEQMFILVAVMWLAGVILSALLANRTIKPSLISIPFACLGYGWLWFSAAYSAYRSTRFIYGYPVKPSFLDDKSENEQGTKAPTRAIRGALISFSITVYGFAIAYVFVSSFEGCFNVGRLGMFSSLYF